MKIIMKTEEDKKKLEILKKINNLNMFDNLFIQQDIIEIGCYVTYIDLYHDIMLHYYTENYKLFDILSELIDEIEDYKNRRNKNENNI